MLKKCFDWIVAIAISFFIMNIVTFSFYRPASEIRRENAATPGIMYPNSRVLYGYEGYGISHIDENGYPNTKTLSGGGTNYFLAVGSSHTEGFHVKKNEKWTYLLETKLNKEVYNIAHSGYYFPAILKNFDCILNEFPYAEKIIIEVDNLLFPSEMIDKCSEQSKYDKSQSYEEIVKNLSTKEKIIHNIKLNVPLLRWLNFQYKTITSIEEYEEKTNDNYKEIIDSYDEIFKLIKSEYDKDIIVVYHPIEIIVNDNEIRFENSDFINLFSECCNTNGIIFIDMSNDFANDFRLNNILHHGFDNTTLGNGHLNKYGNKLIAESLYKFLGGRNE